MIDIVVLSFVLSIPPKAAVQFSSEEKQKDICFYSGTNDVTTTLAEFRKEPCPETQISSADYFSSIKEFSSDISTIPRTVSAYFQQFAAEWQQQSRFDSSTTKAIDRPAYRAIVKLGWDVVPFLLKDVQNGKGFWFPALAEITGVRPFDKSDTGHPRRMRQAWIAWGRKKGLA